MSKKNDENSSVTFKYESDFQLKDVFIRHPNSRLSEAINDTPECVI